MTEQQGRVVILWLKVIAAILAVILIAVGYSTVLTIQTLDSIHSNMAKDRGME